MCQCYLPPWKLAKIYKNILNVCWKCEQNEGYFIICGGCVINLKYLNTNTLSNSEDFKD